MLQHTHTWHPISQLHTQGLPEGRQKTEPGATDPGIASAPPACPPGRTPHKGTHRALESSLGHKSEHGGAGELLSQRLQQTALRGSRKGEPTQGVLYSFGLLQRDLDGPYGLVLTLKSSYALLTAAIAVAGFHSLLFLALGGRECEAAQALNEMHQMETIWKEHPTLTLRATWKKYLQPAKVAFPPTNSPLLTAPRNIPGSWEPSASKELSTEPPALDACKMGCPSAPCQGTVSWWGGRAVEQGMRAAAGARGEAGQPTARWGMAGINQLSNVYHLERQEETQRKLQLRSGICRGGSVRWRFGISSPFPSPCAPNLPSLTANPLHFQIHIYLRATDR